MFKLLTILFALCNVKTSIAQSVGSCSPGPIIEDFDVTKVNHLFFCLIKLHLLKQIKKLTSTLECGIKLKK